MSVYHWLVILILALAVFMRGDRAHNRSFIILAVALMFCVFGLRDCYSVGIDSSTSYVGQFERVSNRDWDQLPDFTDWLGLEEGIEDEERSGHTRNIGLPWVMKAVSEATNGDYQMFIVVTALFVMISFAVFIYRFSPSPIQSILLYFGLLFYTFNFSALKQSIAMAIILFAAAAIVDRKPLWFILLTLLASMFHFPAIVFLPSYWIAHMKLGKSYLLMLSIVFLVTYLFRDQLVTIMTDAYSTIINETTMRFLANKVIVMLFIIVMAVLIRPPVPEDEVYCSFLMLIGVAAVIQTFAGYNNTFERLADYYFQFAVVFIPMAFEDVPPKTRYLREGDRQLLQMVTPYVYGAFAIWRFLQSVQSPLAKLLPYRFFFE